MRNVYLVNTWMNKIGGEIVRPIQSSAIGIIEKQLKAEGFNPISFFTKDKEIDKVKTIENMIARIEKDDPLFIGFSVATDFCYNVIGFTKAIKKVYPILNWTNSSTKKDTAIKIIPAIKQKYVNTLANIIFASG